MFDHFASCAVTYVAMESWNHGFFFGYSTGMAISSLWLLNPENHYSTYRLAHGILKWYSRANWWQHVQPQSRNETQSGLILCGKAMFLSQTWHSPCHFMYVMQTRVLKCPLFICFLLVLCRLCLFVNDFKTFFFPLDLNWNTFLHYMQHFKIIFCMFTIVNVIANKLLILILMYLMLIFYMC